MIKCKILKIRQNAEQKNTRRLYYCNQAHLLFTFTMQSDVPIGNIFKQRQWPNIQYTHTQTPLHRNSTHAHSTWYFDTRRKNACNIYFCFNWTVHSIHREFIISKLFECYSTVVIEWEWYCVIPNKWRLNSTVKSFLLDDWAVSYLSYDYLLLWWQKFYQFVSYRLIPKCRPFVNKYTITMRLTKWTIRYLLCQRFRSISKKKFL